MFCAQTPDIMRTVLVIDDNNSVRDSLRFLFERRGYKVTVAANGIEGIALAAKESFDCAMVDVNMPGLNGIEVCRRLREQAAAAGRSLAVWMMTGARTPELSKRAVEAGAVTLLGKPFDLPELFRRIEEHLSASAPRPAAGESASA